MMENDDTMKIVYFRNRGFGTSLKQQADDSKEYLRQKENGNLEKARLLGEQIAEFVTKEEDFYGLSGMNELFVQEELQVRQLLCYAMIASLPGAIHIPLVADAVESDFLQALKRHSPELYRQFAEGSSYTMYLLSKHRGREPELEAGKTFAVLCGLDSDAVTVEYGETLYSLTAFALSEMVKQTGFTGE